MRHVSRGVITNERLNPTTQKLYAANGTDIVLLRVVELTLMLADYEVTAAVVVSEEVDELEAGGRRSKTLGNEIETQEDNDN